MSIGDLQFEINQQRTKKANSADLAWKLEAIMYDALLKITEQSHDEVSATIAMVALNERQNIIHEHRNLMSGSRW